MRILHALEGHAWSGGQQQALFLCQGQAAAGHEVLLACQAGSELSRRAGGQGFAVRPHDYRRELNPRSLWGLARLLRDFRPTVVNVHRAWAHSQFLLLSLLTGFRGLIVTRRVLFSPERNPLSRAKYRSAGVRGYIAVSAGVQARLQAFGVPGRKLRVVHPATDTARFDPAVDHPLPVRYLPWSGKPWLLLIGNHHRNKGHEVLLAAFARMATTWPEAVLVLAGHGTDGPVLRQRVEALGLAPDRVLLAGFEPDVPALLAQSVLCVNASYEEGFPGSLREAMAMGVPVLASDIPANRELLGARLAAALFPVGDAVALADRLLAARTARVAPGQTVALRQEALARFSLPAMVAATLRAYDELRGEAP